MSFVGIMFPLHIPTNTESKGTVKCTQLSNICNLMNTKSSLLPRLQQSEHKDIHILKIFYSVKHNFVTSNDKH
jgi:hypothetical protein